MTSWKFKACPRCGGDMFLGEDLDDHWYEQCLQCSYKVELKILANPGEQSKLVPVKEKEVVSH